MWIVLYSGRSSPILESHLSLWLCSRTCTLRWRGASLTRGSCQRGSLFKREFTKDPWDHLCWWHGTPGWQPTGHASDPTAFCWHSQPFQAFSQPLKDHLNKIQARRVNFRHFCHYWSPDWRWFILPLPGKHHHTHQRSGCRSKQTHWVGIGALLYTDQRKRGIHMGRKIKVFNAVVTSILLYASGTWTWREEDTKRLETAQYRMAQYMLDMRPTDHVRTTAAYEMLGMIPLWLVLVKWTLV